MKRFGLVVLFIGLLFAGMSFKDSVASMRPWVDLYNADISRVSSWDMVYVDVIEVYGSYATKTTTRNNVKESEVSYYIIPALEGDESFRYIGIAVPEKDYDLFDSIEEATFEYYAGYTFDIKIDDPVIKQGRLKKMNAEMQKYYYEWFEEMEWYETEAEMKAEALPYYIDPIENVEAVKRMFYIGLVVSLAGAVILVIDYMRGKKKANMPDQAFVVIGGVSYPKDTFAHVNQSVQGQEKVFAAQELAQITGLSLEEAGKIVRNWKKYYR